MSKRPLESGEAAPPAKRAKDEPVELALPDAVVINVLAQFLPSYDASWDRSLWPAWDGKVLLGVKAWKPEQEKTILAALSPGFEMQEQYNYDVQDEEDDGDIWTMRHGPVRAEAGLDSDRWQYKFDLNTRRRFGLPHRVDKHFLRHEIEQHEWSVNRRRFISTRLWKHGARVLCCTHRVVGDQTKLVVWKEGEEGGMQWANLSLAPFSPSQPALAFYLSDAHRAIHWQRQPDGSFLSLYERAGVPRAPLDPRWLPPDFCFDGL